MLQKISSIIWRPDMKKILFLIHDLGQGGAEKVLVNLVNNMDHTKFDITVMTLFDHGENRQFLGDKIHYKTWCKKMLPGNSYIMKLLSPQQLHKLIIKDHYDIEVSYLEGPCARIISGCTDESVKLVSWIHIEQYTTKRAVASFRSRNEASACYKRFDKIISVSKTVEMDFQKVLNIDAAYQVLYNTNESEKIRKLSEEKITEDIYRENVVNLVGVGKLLKSKGFDRVLRITKQLISANNLIHLYILGEGPEKETLQNYIKNNGLENNVTLLGYQINPYKYISRCDLFVCASHAEGFSTAATEALILGVPVCTVEVSGMKEMLGENNEYGIVTENDDEALYEGIRCLVESPELLRYYKKQAQKRGDMFSTEKTVAEVENMLLML